MRNIIELFHKLECIPWESIEVEYDINKTINNNNTPLTKIKQENGTTNLPKQEIDKNSNEEAKKPMIINTINELKKDKPKKRDSFQEKIKSIKTISHFSNSLNPNNISNSNFTTNVNNNTNFNLTILPLTSLSQNIPNSTFNDDNNKNIPQNSTVPISNFNSNSNSISLEMAVPTTNLTKSNSNDNHSILQNNYYIKYYFNGDDNVYLFMITDMKDIWYEYIDSEEILNIKKKKNAVNFETQNNIVDLISNNLKNKEVDSTFRIIEQNNNNKHYLCLRLSVPYMYVTFNWDFECILLTNETTIPIVKKENQDKMVAKLDGSKIFYEHLTLPMTLMISELHRRIQRYEDVIAKKDKSIKILYDQLLLLEETPPKRFKFEEFNKKIFDEELRYSTNINLSEQTVFVQEDLVDLYKHVTNTVLSKTFPNLVNDEYTTVSNDERLSLIPTLVSKSNELNGKETIQQLQPTVMASNEENSSSSYNGLSDTTLQDDDNNNLSILEGLEKEKNKETINNLIKNKRNKIETIISKKKDKKKVKKRKLI